MSKRNVRKRKRFCVVPDESYVPQAAQTKAAKPESPPRLRALPSLTDMARKLREGRAFAMYARRHGITEALRKGL